MVRAWDLSATIQFYTTVLGFACQRNYGLWASLRWDNVELMLSAPNSHENDKAPAFTGSLYFHTDAVDELWESVKDRARICYSIETFDYGIREFAIYDNNGYLLQFGQPVPKRAT